MSTLVSGLATFIGDSGILSGTFIDAYEPVPGKSEWGMDTLSRLLRGIQPNIATFVAGLTQGTAYAYNGADYYLQTFAPDNDPVFPGVQCAYKGLHGGIPNPKATGSSIEQCVTLCANGVGIYTTATRDIRYITRQTSTLYIATSRPTGPTYGVDVDLDIFILSSVIRAEDVAGNSYVFNGADAPADLVTALTPATAVQAFMHCTPVVGSPYFECEDTATKLYVGS